MIILLILGVLLGACVVVFTLQNITPITVAFLGWHFDGSLALILVLAVVSGMLLCWLLSLPTIFVRRAQISHLKDKTVELKDKLAVKETEVEAEKNKVAANNAYLDELEKPKLGG